MIISTHFLDEVDILADHVVIISRGCFKAEGSTVELKAQYAKGYKLFLENQNPDTEMAAAIRRPTEPRVLEAPDSTTAICLLAALERKGHVEVAIRGPTIEDVFMSTCDEPQCVQKESTTESVGDDSAHNQDAIATAAAVPEMNLSPGSPPTFWLQARILFLKRFTILRRNWWPYLIAIAIPLITTPNLKTILSYYKTPSCNSSVALNVHSVQPVNLEAATHDIHHMQILAGPPSTNDSIYNVISRFPIGTGIDLPNYANQFVFAENLVDLEDLVSEKFSTIAPGALYMGDNFSAPTYAFVGDARIYPAMVMQNLWSQVKGGLAISVSYAPFDSFIPV
jgi:ATP-binding cassette, subfamily A (ABC1), member 3